MTFCMHDTSIGKCFFFDLSRCDRRLKFSEDECECFDRVHITWDEVFCLIDISRRSEECKSYDLTTFRLGKCEIFISSIDDEEYIRQFFHIFHSLICFLEFREFFQFYRFFFFCQGIERSILEVFFELIIIVDTFLDRREVRDESGNPFRAHIEVSCLFRDHFDEIASLDFRPDEEYRLSGVRQIL